MVGIQVLALSFLLLILLGPLFPHYCSLCLPPNLSLGLCSLSVICLAPLVL